LADLDSQKQQSFAAGSEYRLDLKRPKRSKYLVLMATRVWHYKNFDFSENNLNEIIRNVDPGLQGGMT